MTTSEALRSALAAEADQAPSGEEAFEAWWETYPAPESQAWIAHDAFLAGRQSALTPDPLPGGEGSDALLEAMCRAHDQEEAAQRGEPSPWRDEGDDFETFRADRIAAMRAAWSAMIEAAPQGDGAVLGEKRR